MVSQRMRIAAVCMQCSVILYTVPFGQRVSSRIEDWGNETDMNETAHAITIAHGDDDKVNGRIDASWESEW